MENRLTWTQSALLRIFRPAVRLALGMGLKHAQLEEILRDLLLDEARLLWRSRGVANPNLSQLSITTGLNRKDVTARVRQARDPLPMTESSAAAKAFTAWLQLATEQPRKRCLPVADAGEGPSFELLARLATRGNVHHKTLLQELQRLELVRLREGANPAEVELVAEAFIPANSLQDMLAFTADNVHDHLQAAVRNTLGGQPRLLERAVFASGITPQDAERVHQQVRKHWEAVHYRLVRTLTKAHADAAGEGNSRIRVGVYVYLEDQSADDPKMSPPQGESVP